MSLRTSRFVELPFALALVLLLTACGGSSPAPITPPPAEPSPTTPIHHVIIVVGENHGFDNVFATYQPADPAQHVWNLLSQGIVNANGDPGPNYSIAAQQQATDTDFYRNSPPQTGPYDMLPQPSTAVQPLLLSFAEQFSIASDPGLAPADQGLVNLGGVLNITPYSIPGRPTRVFQPTCQTGRFKSPSTGVTTTPSAIRCTASFKCGSRTIAA